VRLSISS